MYSVRGGLGGRGAGKWLACGVNLVVINRLDFRGVQVIAGRRIMRTNEADLLGFNSPRI